MELYLRCNLHLLFLSVMILNLNYKTMKKRFLILLVLSLLMVFPLQGQLSFGIRGGFNNSNVKLSDYSTSSFEIDYGKANYGYHFGVMGQLKLLGAFIQPELLFTTTKNSLAFKDHLRNMTTYGDVRYHRLDLPVMLGVKFGPLKLQAGPIASVLLNSKSDVLKQAGVQQNLNSATVGFQAGIGLELSSLLLDLKYEGNLSKLGDGMVINGTTVNFDQRVNQIILSIGYLF